MSIKHPDGLEVVVENGVRYFRIPSSYLMAARDGQTCGYKCSECGILNLFNETFILPHDVRYVCDNCQAKNQKERGAYR